MIEPDTLPPRPSRRPLSTVPGGGSRRIVRKREGSPSWERPALLALLLLTAMLYVWDLGASGWANSFYSAAVQAGTQDWTAFFYGSSDAANSITVDKPPASLWIMALSARVFGLSPWSILLPEAAMGVASVGVLYASVRRAFSAGTALLAAAVLALTPVAALMFRFNNPDALLALLLALAGYFTLRGIETGALRWLHWAAGMVGLGFLTKQLQAFLILPVLAGVYLLSSRRALPIRFGHLFAALGMVLVSAGWWVAIVELVPEDWRPYIGGSQANSFLELTFGYNGFGRLTGQETGSVTGGARVGGHWGETGLLRLFTGEFGGQIAWLLPAALLLGMLGIGLLWRAPRIDIRRATLLLFGGTLVVTALAFSLMAGIFHAYYAVAMAVPLAGTVAVGASLLWSARSALWARIAAAVVVVGTAAYSWYLLELAAEWMPALKFVVLALGLLAATLLLVPRAGRTVTVAALSVVATAGLIAPLAYTMQTVTTVHGGSIVTAGPAVAAGRGGSFPGGAPRGRSAGLSPPPRTDAAGSGRVGAGPPVGAPPMGGVPGGGVRAVGGGFGGAGGLFGVASASAKVVDLLTQDSVDYVWVAATVGSDSAACYQLASGKAVMPIGGFNGNDPSPTLAQFIRDVALGKVHYFLAGRSLGHANGGSSASLAISEWVAENYSAQTVDGVTLYDLSR